MSVAQDSTMSKRERKSSPCSDVLVVGYWCRFRPFPSCTRRISRHFRLTSSLASLLIHNLTMKASSSSIVSPPRRSAMLSVEQQAEAMVQLVRARSASRAAPSPLQRQQPQGRIDYCSPRYGQPVERPAAVTAPSAASSSSSSGPSSAAAASSSPLVLPLPAACITLGAARRASPSSINGALIAMAQALLHSIAGSNADVGPFARLDEHLHGMLLDSLPTLPSVLIDLILQNLQGVSLPFFVSPRCGPHHGDSAPWSSVTLPSTTLLLAGWQLRQIIGWGGEYANGVQLVLGPPHVGPVCKREAEGTSGASALGEGLRAAGASVVRAARSVANTLAGNGSSSSSGGNDAGIDLNLSRCPGFFTSPDQHGSHHAPVRTSFVLRPDEIVVEVTFNVGSHGDSLRFRTNLGRTYRIGRSDGGDPFVFRAPPHAALVGLCGEVGGHLHNVGTIWAPTRKLTHAELEGNLPVTDDDGLSPSAAPPAAASSSSSSSSFAPSGNFSGGSSNRTKGLDE